jgi:hypothetical protein
LLLATARSARSGQQLLDPRTGEEHGWQFDTTPLLALAAAARPPRERAFALNNAAWLLVAANTPASLNTAAELASRAQALAPTEPCLRPLYGRGFISEHSSPACTLPLLP